MLGLFRLIRDFPVLAFIYGISLLLIALSGLVIYEGKASESWSVTEGVVLGVLSTKLGENTFSGGYRSSAEYLSVVVKRIRYRYTVGDREFSSVGSSEQALKAAGGEKIAVYYDPANPASSLLEVGVDWHRVGMWLALASLAAFAGMLWFRFIQRNFGQA